MSQALTLVRPTQSGSEGQTLLAPIDFLVLSKKAAQWRLGVLSMNCFEVRAGHQEDRGNQERADAEPEATILWSP